MSLALDCPTSQPPLRPRPQIIPRLLYLGDWSHAQNGEVLEELNIGAVVTAHNNADDCRVPRGIRHLRIALPDVETENIRKHFDAAFDAVDGAKASGKACLSESEGTCELCSTMRVSAVPR